MADASAENGSGNAFGDQDLFLVHSVLNIPAAAISYIPPQGVFDFVGEGETTTDTITYVVRDSHGATSTGTVTVSIEGTNDAPVVTAIDAGTALPVFGDGGLPIFVDAGVIINDIDNADQPHLSGPV